MKKFILMCALAFGMIALQSCDEKFGLIYSLTAEGDAVGNVQFNIPVGHIALTGEADVNMLITNDSTKLFAVAPNEVYLLGDALNADDTKVAEAAVSVEDWLEQSFSVTTASGDYYVHVIGFVKEPVTGLNFTVDKVFTNRADSAFVAVPVPVEVPVGGVTSPVDSVL